MGYLEILYFVSAVLAGVVVVSVGFKQTYGTYLPYLKIEQYAADEGDQNWVRAFTRLMKRAKHSVVLTTLQFTTLDYPAIAQAIRAAVSRGVNVKAYVPEDMATDRIDLLRSLGCVVERVPSGTFGPSGTWNHILLVDNRDWAYLPPHPPTKGGREVQVGMNDFARAERWLRELNSTVSSQRAAQSH